MAWTAARSNTLALYVARGLQLGTLLAVTLIVARYGGAAEFGLFASAQALAVLSSMLVELGFNLSATRRALSPSADLPKLVREVTSAKFALTALLGLGFLASSFLPVWKQPDYILPCFLLAAALSNNISWYSLSQKKMVAIAISEIFATGCMAAMIFAWWWFDGGGTTALYALAAYYAVSAASAAIITRYPVGALDLAPASLSKTIQSTRGAFGFRLSQMVYLNCLLLVLPLFANPIDVGAFALGMKFVQLQNTSVFPLHQLLFIGVAKRRTSFGRRIIFLRYLMPIVATTALIAAIGSALVLFFLKPVFGGDFVGKEMEICAVLLVGVAGSALTTVITAIVTSAGRFKFGAAAMAGSAMILASAAIVLYDTEGLIAVIAARGALEVGLAITMFCMFLLGRRREPRPVPNEDAGADAL